MGSGCSTSVEVGQDERPDSLCDDSGLKTYRPQQQQQQQQPPPSVATAENGPTADQIRAALGPQFSPQQISPSVPVVWQSWPLVLRNQGLVRSGLLAASSTASVPGAAEDIERIPGTVAVSGAGPCRCAGCIAPKL